VTRNVVPKSLGRTTGRNVGSSSNLLKKLERLVNKELRNKIHKGHHLAGEGVGLQEVDATTSIALHMHVLMAT
jgi:hypothetical protein